MLKIKVFFILSMILLVSAISMFVHSALNTPDVEPQFQYTQNLASLASPEETVSKTLSSSELPPIQNADFDKTQTKETKNSFPTGLLLLVGIALLALVKSAKSIAQKLVEIKNILKDRTSNAEVEEALRQLKILQDNSSSKFSLKDIKVTTRRLAKEINDLLKDMSDEELNKIEIKSTKKKQYTQSEKRYVKPLNYSEPTLIAQTPITDTKGFYLVDCGCRKALVGYIKNNVFVLNNFEKTNSPCIQVRLTEKIGRRNIYLVKNGKYKALVQVEKENMKVLLEI